MNDDYDDHEIDQMKITRFKPRQRKDQFVRLVACAFENRSTGEHLSFELFNATPHVIPKGKVEVQVRHFNGKISWRSFPFLGPLSPGKTAQVQGFVLTVSETDEIHLSHIVDEANVQQVPVRGILKRDSSRWKALVPKS